MFLSKHEILPGVVSKHVSILIIRASEYVFLLLCLSTVPPPPYLPPPPAPQQALTTENESQQFGFAIVYYHQNTSFKGSHLKCVVMGFNLL